MSRHKSERLYKGRGANTRRKRHQANPKSGPPTPHKGKGFKFIVFCSTCEPVFFRGGQVGGIGVDANSKSAICKLGHRTTIVGG